MPPDGERDELSRSELIELLRRGPLTQEQQDELERCRLAQSAQRELPFGDDLHHDLSRTGWGVVWLIEEADELRQRLAPLLAHRRQQARELYREVSCKPHVLPRHFFAEHGLAPGVVDPKRLPYFLLLVGDPERIPFELQYQLSINRAVGRLHFADPADYERYAKAVVQAERGGVDLPRKGVLFEVRNGDRATDRLAAHLVAPLADQLPSVAASRSWEIDVRRDELARKEALARLLDGEAPGWLLASCHGKSCTPGEADQEARQGALICQDWQSRTGRKSTPEEFFQAADLSDDVRVDGLIAFFCACYGAGTPLVDNFPHETPEAAQSDRPLELPANALTLRPFVARLPQALLARGALAVVGHVDRGWTLSFSWVKDGEHIPAVETLRDVLTRLLAGHRLGHALRPLHRRYAALAAQLVEPLERLRGGEKVDEDELAFLWTAHNDARNFIVVGDPAVYLLGRPSRAASTSSEDDGTDATPSVASAPSADSSSSNPEPSTEPRQPSSDLPDLLLMVREERSEGQTRLGFQAIVHDAGLSWNQRSFPPKTLRQDAQEYFEGHFRDIEALTWDDEEQRYEARTKLESLGVALFEDLLPRELREVLDDLWRRWTGRDRSTAPTLQILSPETWIPWQLLKLQDPDEERAGPFLAEAFAMTRWLEGDEVPLAKVVELPLERLALIVPDDSGLRHAPEEAKAVHELLTAAGRPVEPVTATFREVVGSLASGLYEGWHMTGHGFAWGKIPDGWGLQLARGGILHTVHLRGEARGLGKARPLIFLNACHSGHGGASLTRLGGFAATFLELGAGALIGASWAAQDHAAALFAQAFYRELLDGVAIGEAVRRARLAVRDACPGDPTWLTYSVYAHPLASCRPADAPVPGSPSPTEPPVEPPPIEEPGPRSRWLEAILGLIVAMMLFAGILAIRWDTPVHLELVVEQLRFTVGGDKPAQLIDGTVSWRSLQIEHFSRIDLSGRDLATSENGLWLTTEKDGKIVLTAGSNATLKNVDPAAPGALAPLWVEPGTLVVLKLHPSGNDLDLTFELDPPPSDLDISLPDFFQLEASDVFVDSSEMAFSRFFVSGAPSTDGSSIRVSNSGPLTLITTVDEAWLEEPLLRTALPIVDLELFKQGLTGGFETSLRVEGKLIYPDQPRRTVKLNREDFIGVESAEAILLSRISVDTENDGLRIVLDADASKIRSGPSSDRLRDRRLRLGEILFGQF